MSAASQPVGNLQWKRSIAVGALLAAAALGAVLWSTPTEVPVSAETDRAYHLAALRRCSPLQVSDPDWAGRVRSYEAVTLQRTPCLGNCPIYAVRFGRDGRALKVVPHPETGEPVEQTRPLSPQLYSKIAHLAAHARIEQTGHFQPAPPDIPQAVVILDSGDSPVKANSFLDRGSEEIEALVQCLDNEQAAVFGDSRDGI